MMTNWKRLLKQGGMIDEAKKAAYNILGHSSIPEN